jgi:hypothetical protein
MCCRADLDPPMEEPPTCGLAITLCPLAGDEPQQRAALTRAAITTITVSVPDTTGVAEPRLTATVLGARSPCTVPESATCGLEARSAGLITCGWLVCPRRSVARAFPSGRLRTPERW